LCYHQAELKLKGDGVRQKILYTSGLILLIAVLGITLIKSASAAVPGINQLVSYSYSGGGPANASSGGAAISPSGKFVVFDSTATNIVGPSHAEDIGHVYIRNLISNTSAQVDVSTSGVSANANSGILARNVSDTGRYVIFTSVASNLIDGTSIITTVPQLYLRDTISNTTTLLSVNSSGVISNGANLYGEGVSSDGRFILFTTDATNLDPDATTGSHVYMLDRLTDTFSILDRHEDGTIGTDSVSWPPVASMSCDGSLIVFQYPSLLTQVQNPTHEADVYLLDRRAGNILTNLTSFGNGVSITPSISCNGDYVGFSSHATNIDTSVSLTTTSINDYHAYVYDRINGAFHIVDTTSPTGLPASPGVCSSSSLGTSCISLSDNGLVVFGANPTIITGVNTRQIYLHHIDSNTTELLSKSANGDPANGSGSYTASGIGAISADGRIVTYQSTATNLVNIYNPNGFLNIFTSLTGE
jgi:hypothetical protein